jgi:hypothetical protein
LTGDLAGDLAGNLVGELGGNLICDLAWGLRRWRLSLGLCFAANLGVGVASGLSLRGRVGFGDLAFFAACGSLGDGGGFGAAGGFDTFCCGGARCLFGLAKSMAHGGVGVVGLMSTGGLGCVTCGGLGGSGGGFGLGLGQQRLLADLLGGAMSQLRAILAAGSGEVAIFCSVEIRPGVEDRHIFGGLRYYRFVGLVRAARIHISCSLRGYRVAFT